MPSESGTFNKVVITFNLALLLLGSGIAYSVLGNTAKIIDNQTMIIKILEKQTDTMNLLSKTIDIAMERQVTKDHLSSALKEAHKR